MKLSIRILKGIGIAIALMLLAFGAARAQDMKKVTIQIDGAAVPYYLPMFVAAHYGYFKDEGLEVDFLYANAADILNNVAVGNVQFGFPNGDAVIAARANGLPIKVAHTTYYNGIVDFTQRFFTPRALRNASNCSALSQPATSKGLGFSFGFRVLGTAASNAFANSGGKVSTNRIAGKSASSRTPGRASMTPILSNSRTI